MPSNQASNPSSSQIRDNIALLLLHILPGVIRAGPDPRLPKPITAWLPAPHACRRPVELQRLQLREHTMLLFRPCSGDWRSWSTRTLRQGSKLEGRAPEVAQNRRLDW